MTGTSPFGSYAFGAFVSNDAELGRLERQASVAWPMERERLKAAGLLADMRVLDLACGPGFISRRIAGEMGPGGAVLGVDLNDRLLDVAYENARDRNSEGKGGAELSFMRGDVYRLDLPDNHFDFVYARFLFQHLERPIDAMIEVRRVLKPGGKLVIADIDDSVFSILPEPAGLKALFDLAAQGQRDLGGDRQVGRKLPYYLKKSGFGDVKTDIAVITSDDIGLDAFLGITVRFKVELLPENQRTQARELLDSVWDASGDTVHAMAGVYAVSGVAPAAL